MERHATTSGRDPIAKALAAIHGFIRVGVCVGACFACPPPLECAASSWLERRVESVAAESESIVRARVVETTSRWDGDDIVTDATFELVYPIHGDASASFQVRALGGFLPAENLGMTATDEPRFAPGEEWVLFLTRGEGALRLASGSLGAFRVRGAMAVGEEITATLGDLYGRVAKGLAETGRAAAPPEDWKAIEDEIAATKPAANIDKNYVLTGTKWPGASPVKVPVRVNANSKRVGPYGTAQQFAEAIMDGAYGWNFATTSNFEFYYAGASTATTFTRNNLNEVMFETWTVTGTSYPPLAQTKRWYDGDNYLLEVDTRINDYYYCIPLPPTISGSAYDLATLTLHEFGHWLSLSHDSSSTSVMYASQAPWSVRRMLGSTDAQGIGALYPNGYVAVPPPNDGRWSAAQVCSGEAYGDLTKSGQDGGLMPCLGITPPNDVWFKYSPSYDGQVTLGTCGSGVPNYIQVYIEKADFSLYPAFCGSPCAMNPAMAQVSFQGCGGLNYLIRIVGRPDAPEGYYHLELSGPPCGGAPADALPQIKNYLVGKPVVGPFTFELLDTDGNGAVDVTDLTKAVVAREK